MAILVLLPDNGGARSGSSKQMTRRAGPTASTSRLTPCTESLPATSAMAPAFAGLTEFLVVALFRGRPINRLSGSEAKRAAGLV